MTEQEKKYAAQFAKALVDAKLLYDFSDANKVLGEGDWRDERYGVGVRFTTKGAYDLPSADDVRVAEITISDMYDHFWSSPLAIMEVAAQVFGSRKINVGQVEGYSSGCETCGYGGHHELKLFVIEPMLEE
jgi:hypothetical protein